MFIEIFSTFFLFDFTNGYMAHELILKGSTGLIPMAAFLWGEAEGCMGKDSDPYNSLTQILRILTKTFLLPFRIQLVFNIQQFPPTDFKQDAGCVRHLGVLMDAVYILRKSGMSERDP